MSLIATSKSNAAGTALYPLGSTAATAQRIVYGVLTTNSGTVTTAGSAGWDVATNGVGDATVTFDVAFHTAPVVVLSAKTAKRTAIAANITVNGFDVNSLSVQTTPAAADSIVEFIAIGRAA